jgi:pentatricopeptide repeat protein
MAVRKKSLYDGLGPIRRWRVSFDAITEANAQENNSQNHPIQLFLSKGDEALLEKLKVDPEQSFSTTWAALKKAKKIGHWERLSLWLLYHYPELVPTFLRITCAKPIKPVFSCVSACILYLQRFFPGLVDKSLITTCLHPSVWPVLLLPQKGVRVYLRTADRSGVYYAWNLTQKKRLHMTPQSILCFMNRFTEFRDIDRALEAVQIVRNMKHPILDLRSESVIRHCCKLLTLDSVVGDGNSRNFHILPKLLELGVKPTRDLMNVVLSNAYKTGDPWVGQSILDYMKQQKMEPDSFTYLALLTDAVRMGDRERLESLLQEIKPKKELHRNPWISSKILHSHFVFTAKQINPDEDPYAVFYSMLDMYNRLHDITPLKELSIIPHHYTPPEGSANTPPSIVALYIMIATYLRCMRSFNLTEHVCARFKALVMEGHELIAPLAATDHVYNEFLAAFRKDPRGLRSSVQLIDHMLHNASSDASSTNVANSVFKNAAPTVRTWTLLMSAFVFNKQPLAAEKVRAMMNKHGVEYQLWTWNIIINSYANSQNVPALAQAIKDMERKGLAPDKYTLNSLRYLQDPERLWVAIDELDRISNRGSAAIPTDEENVEKEKDGGSLLEQGLRRLKDTMAAKS